VSATTLSDADFARAAKELNVEEAAIRAVAEVEAAGQGFIADGRPAILYEAHVFHRLTKGAHTAAKDRKGVLLSTGKWDRSLYGATGGNQHDRLQDAAKLDATAAHKACSWGTFQIMGENYKAAGCSTIDEFVDRMKSGAGAHLDAFVAFIKADPKLHDALRAKQWATFARIYNGPAYAQNAYDKKMANAYARWKAKL
jgi:N-acetylmuramidase